MNWTQTRQRLIEHGIPVERLPEEWQPGINLREANLTGADLTGADLTGANLTGAYGPFTAGSFGRHHAVAAGGHISIGCQRHTYAEWLEHYEKIGRANGYSNDEIADYGAWIRLAVARQRRIEQPTPAAVEPATE